MPSAILASYILPESPATTAGLKAHHGALDGAPWFFNAPQRVQASTRTFAATGLQPLAALAAFFLAGDARLSGQPPVAVHRPLFSGSRPVRSKHVYASLRRRRVKAAAAFFVRRWNGAWCRPLAKDAWWAAMFFYMARREFAPGAPIFN